MQPAIFPHARPMFLADRLIYLQLQKTGSTHVAEMLGRCISGRQIGKHTLLTDYRTKRYVAVRSAIPGSGISHYGLESDLVRVLEEAGYRLSAEQVETIREGAKSKRNASRHRPASHYYDRESIELVGRGEWFLAGVANRVAGLVC